MKEVQNVGSQLLRCLLYITLAADNRTGTLMINKVDCNITHCPICLSQRPNKAHYCPCCGLSYMSLRQLHLIDLWTDQSGFAACTPTGCTECDCFTTNQTPRHLRPKPITQTISQPVVKPEPKVEEIIFPQDAQNTGTPQSVAPPRKERMCCLGSCVNGACGCIGSLFKGLLTLVAWLAGIAFVGFFIYLLFYWLERQ